MFSRINSFAGSVSAVEEAKGREALAHVCRLRLEDDPDYAAAVILTIIHQIKRKLLGLPVNDHLTLTIYSSEGGTGKSEFIRALLRPLGKLSANTSLGELLDDRNVALWSQYALNLDDLDESAARQRGQFRRRITQAEWTARVLGTGETRSVINNATILGTTHHRIFEIMPDRFSMRRFAELHGRETRPDDEAISAVDLADWPAIWRSVDPEGPCPIDKLGFRAILRDRQAAARVRGPVEQWLDDLAPADPSLAAHANPNGWIKASDLYERCYKPYAERNLGAEGRLSKDGFGKDLRALLRTRGARAPLEVRNGRITTEYRIVALPPERPTAPTPPTTARLLPQLGTTRH